MNEESIVMHCTTGGSDKVYKLQLVELLEGWVVNFQYGRRVPGPGHQIQGTNGGTKTSAPLPYATALATYQAQINAQMGKSYVTISSNIEATRSDQFSAVVFAERKPMSGMFPMLLMEVKTEEQARQLCQNPSYCAQEKEDGERRLLAKDGQLAVRGINRKGEYVELPASIRSAANQIFLNTFVLDGEIIGEVLKVWDILDQNGDSVREDGMRVRYERLKNQVNNSQDGSIRICRTAFTAESKLFLFNEVKARGGEGIVFKLVAAPYVEGLSKYSLKWKFKADATVQVVSISKTKRSIQMGVTGSDGDLQILGKVTIPPNHAIPVVGAMVDVEYLYCYPNGGSLFQTAYKSPRQDKDEPDTYASLKFKKAFDPDSDDLVEGLTTEEAA